MPSQDLRQVLGDAEDVALATQNLQNSKSDAVDNLSNITQYQNAIATITGKSPSTFYLILPPEPTFPTPTIPQSYSIRCCSAQTRHCGIRKKRCNCECWNWNCQKRIFPELQYHRLYKFSRQWF